jgi:hypothetical protein
MRRRRRWWEEEEEEELMRVCIMRVSISRHRKTHADVCFYMQYVVCNVLWYVYAIHTGTHVCINTLINSRM